MRVLIFILFTSFLFSFDYYYNKGVKVPIVASKTRSNNTAYTTLDNFSLSINKTIIVKFKDIKDKNKIIKKYNLNKEEKLYANVYLFEVETLLDTLKVANQIYENENIVFSHPNFSKKIRQRTLDPLYKYAWHLKNYQANTHIYIEGAFKFTKGDNVNVGVYDDGLDSKHIDLKSNVLKSVKNNLWNLATFNRNLTHGTQVSGLISALENNIGSVGVSPKSKIFFIQLPTSIDEFGLESSTKEISSYDVIRVFEYLDKNNVAIVNNSWGSYHTNDVFRDYVYHLSVNGRDGKGMLIVFASGNKGYNYDEDLSLDDESEAKGVISVNAINAGGILASYSNYGSRIDITAPGGDLSGSKIVTTKINSKYTHQFVGTSASSPIVSGVLALILSINPDLTRAEVMDILRKSSLKIGDKSSYKYGRNNKYGYGLINATNAVKEAILSYIDVIQGKKFRINGEFILADNGKFLYKNSNGYYFSLNPKKSTYDNPYGFIKTNSSSSNKTSYYLVKIRNILRKDYKVQDLMIIDAKSRYIYKATKLDNNFVEYSFYIDLNSSISKARGMDKFISFNKTRSF